MDPIRIRQVIELYQRTIERPIHDRSGFLASACRDDEVLRRAVQELLDRSQAPTAITTEWHGGTTTPGLSPAHPLHQSVLHYDLVERLGEGGMGVVCKARDTRLNRLVALKFPKVETGTDIAARQVVLMEARAASALNHPNICTIHAVEDGFADPFIVMEFVEGERLSDRLYNRALGVDEAIDIGRQLARGLRTAHDHGIIHRDIKPQNVMITRAGLVKIMDFGIAIIASGGSTMNSRSAVGTLVYMSPEQLTGAELDVRSDLFSLGVVLYELVTRRRPFTSTDRQVLLREIGTTPPIPPSEMAAAVPLAFDRIVLRCLESDARRRYQTASEIEKALDDLHTTYQVGSQRAIAPAVAGAAVRETERRRATLLMGELLPSGNNLRSNEDIADVARTMMASVIDVIEQYGGTIDRVTGNSFAALFGLPLATEGATRNALSAALTIRSSVHQAERSLTCRMGVDAGLVLAGAIGSGAQRRYSVTGATVDHAVELQQAAPPGHIYVGSGAEREGQRHFTLTVVRESRSAQPDFGIFDLVAAASGVGPSSESISSAHPLLGRDDELRQLEDAIASLGDGKGAVIYVIGEPGIGKSRVVAECLQHATADITILSGRASSTGQHFGHHVLVDLVKRWADIHDSDTRIVAARKLQALLAAVADEMAEEQFPFIAAMLGLGDHAPAAVSATGIEGDVLGRLMLKHIRTLLIKAAAAAPTIVWLEDLHWADQSSLDLLESLFRLAVDHRLLFLASVRPGYDRTTGRILDMARRRLANRFVEMSLGRLDAVASRRLLDVSLQDWPLATLARQRIVERTGGNPYFIGEIAASVRAGGDAPIPDTLEELLVARMDLLPEAERSLLATASVIGRAFLYRTLEAITSSPAELEECVRHLVKAGFLGTREQGPETECYFHHALMQEAVYRTLVPSVCRQMHLRTAAAIERLFSGRLNEFYGMLALHYTYGAAYDKAEAYLALAGTEALKSAASGEAIHYYQDALNAYIRHAGENADPERKAHFERNIGLAFYTKGYMAKAVEHFDRALALWGVPIPRNATLRQIRLVRDLTSVLVRLYIVRRQPMRAPDAREMDIIETWHKKGQAVVSYDPAGFFAEAVAVLRQINQFDIRQVTNGAGIYSSVSALFSVPAISFRVGRRILEYTRPFIRDDDSRALIRFRVSQNLLAMMVGDWRDVPALEPTLIEACQAQGDQWFLWVYLYFYANVLTEQGRYDETDHVLGLLKELGDFYESDLVRARRAIGEARLRLKRRQLEEANLVAIASAVPAIVEFGNPPLLIHMRSMQARLEFGRGDLAAAEEYVRAAAEILARERRVPPYYTSSYFVARLEISLHTFEASPRTQADYREAGAAVRDAIRVSRVNAIDRPEILRLAGTYAWLKGKRRQAFRLWNSSVTEGLKLGAMPEVARTREEIVRRSAIDR